MVAWALAAALSAPRGALQVAWLTSVFPATTARPGSGERKEPLGITILSGRRQPSFSGRSSPVRQRKTYRVAALVTAGGALKLPSLWLLVPLKSTTASRLA